MYDMLLSYNKRWYRDSFALFMRDHGKGFLNVISPGKAGEHMKPKKQTSCDSCVNYVYDEDYEYYVCEANLDEDDMARFLGGQSFSCPYYQLDDEYAVVRHQM